MSKACFNRPDALKTQRRYGVSCAIVSKKNITSALMLQVSVVDSNGLSGIGKIVSVLFVLNIRQCHLSLDENSP